MTPRNTHFDNNNDGGKDDDGDGNDDDGDGNDDDGNDDDGKTKLTAASFFWVINNFSFFLLRPRNTERELSRPERSGKRLKDARNWFLVSLLLL